jgi:ABC-type multidrug transport system fused ATPase/permease subunit
LDVQTEARIVDRLASRYKGLTVLVVAHRIGALRSCDRLVVIREGVATVEIERDPTLPAGYPPLTELLPRDES